MSSKESPRLEALHAWLAGTLARERIHDYALTPASADASFRRYFRISTSDGTRIVMDAPPGNEDCRPFVKVARLLREAGVNAPEVQAADFDQGFLLLTDLGRETYLDVINDANADRYFRPAHEALVQWQSASRPGVLPDYTQAQILAELELFAQWYLGRHCGVALDSAQRDVLDGAFRRIVERCVAQPQVFVHADFMPRNLMACEPLPGVIDFQDAVCGPIAYDIASLYRDAFISWEEERILDGTVRYWEAARRAALPVPAQFGEFYEAAEWTGLQRHLRILGTFARLHYRDGKPGYLVDAPRFVGYVRHACHRYAALKPLLRLLDALGIGEPSVAGFSYSG